MYLRDENGKLKKQEITVGRLSSWGEGYEILDGVTWEDWLAFPLRKEREKRRRYPGKALWTSCTDIKEGRA